MKSFTQDEFKILEEKYRLTIQTNPSTLSIQTKQLLHEDELKTFLTHVKERTKAANLAVAASLFVKRYSFAVLIALFSMSAFNKRIDYSFENISIQTLDDKDPLWLASIKLEQLNVTEIPQSDRAKWRNEVLSDIFNGNIEVLFNNLNKVSKLSKFIMWENVFVYIQWLYKNLLEDTNSSDLKQIIESDFNYITKECNGLLFGDYAKNPFLKFSVSPCSSSERKTCCLSYLTESKGAFCNTCPIRFSKKKN